MSKTEVESFDYFSYDLIEITNLNTYISDIEIELDALLNKSNSHSQSSLTRCNDDDNTDTDENTIWDCRASELKSTSFHLLNGNHSIFNSLIDLLTALSPSASTVAIPISPQNNSIFADFLIDSDVEIIVPSLLSNQLRRNDIERLFRTQEKVTADDLKKNWLLEEEEENVESENIDALNSTPSTDNDAEDCSTEKVNSLTVSKAFEVDILIAEDQTSGPTTITPPASQTGIVKKLDFESTEAQVNKSAKPDEIVVNNARTSSSNNPITTLGTGTDAGIGTDTTTTAASSSYFRSPHVPPTRFNSNKPDERLRGDATSWDSGPRLTPEGIKAAYSGLYDILPANSHNLSAIFVQEFVVRPDVPLLTLMNTIAIAAKSTQLIFTRKQRSQGIISYPQIPALQSPEAYKSRRAMAARESNDDIERDWDMVDVQVCISKELKQRVILCQFLRKLRSLPGSKDGFDRSPRILRINKALQRHLNNARLSISNLYSLEPANVWEDYQVDSHFYVQLENFYREQMWVTLESEFDAMDNHLNEAKEDFMVFRKAIQPIYLQHGLAFPDITTDEDSSSSKENVFRKRTMTINESMEFVDIGTAQSNSSDNEDSHDGLKSFDSTAQTTSKSDKIRTSVTHSRVIQSAVEELRAGDGSDTYADGMEKCLACMNALSKHLLKVCDRELAIRLQKQNWFIVLRVTRLNDLTRDLLYALAESEIAEGSILNRNFLALFEGVTLSTASTFSRFLSSTFANKAKIPPPVVASIPIHDYLTPLAFETPRAKYNDSATTSSNQITPANSQYHTAVGKSTPLSTTQQTISSEKSRSTNMFSSFGTLLDNMNLLTPRSNSSSAINSSRNASDSNLKPTSNISTDTPLNDTDINYKFSMQPLSTNKIGNTGWGGSIYRIVVLYSCAVFISTLSLPGNIYITPEFLFVMSGVQIPGLSAAVFTQRECFSLRQLDSTSIVTSTTMPFMTSNTLQLLFYNETKILYLTPAVISRTLLKNILTTIKDHFVGCAQSKR